MLGIATSILGLVGGSPLVKLVAGERGAQIAESVIGVARRLTGADSAETALAKLSQDPEKVLQLQRELVQLERDELAAETERLARINETMRAEIASEDPYVRRWRPYWGYWTARAWVAQVAATVVAIVASAVLAIMGRASDAAILLKAVAELSEASFAAWAVALSVLGLQVYKRSQDKQTKAGAPAPTGGIMATLAERLGRGAR